MGEADWAKGEVAERGRMTSDNSIVPQKKSALMAKIVQQLKSTPIIQIAVERASVGRTTYYRWRRENKKFARQCDESLDEGYKLINDLAEAKLLTAMKDNNLTAIMYWLNHRHDTYRNKLELSGSVASKSEKLSPEQEASIKKALMLMLLVDPKGGQNVKKEGK